MAFLHNLTKPVCVCARAEERRGDGISVRPSTGPLTARTLDVVEIKRCVKVFDLHSAARQHQPKPITNETQGRAAFLLCAAPLSSDLYLCVRQNVDRLTFL